jgi:PKD repeat protein
MKKLLLLAFIIASVAVSAQNDSINTGNCKARFYYTVNSQVQSDVPSSTINFFDESDGNVIEWFWDFGDEEISTEKHPTHVYILPVTPNGSLVKINPYRTVSLTIVTSEGCKSTFSQLINIYDIPADGGKTCKSDFYFYQTGFDSLAQTASFKFVNMGNSDSESYLWNFSDGITSTEFEPEMTFDFSRTERKVCLTVLGADSCSDELCQAVYINPSGGDINLGDTTSSNCFVAFGYTTNYSVQTFAPALVLDFYSKTENSVAKYLWDFGDGTSSDEANPTHIFNFPTAEDSILGDQNHIRTICLTITTTDGCESSWCEVVDLYTGTYPEDKCTAWFKFYEAEDVVTIPEVIPFKLVATNDAAVSWLWEFEDGTTSTDRELVVNFDAFKETQKVCLTTTNNEGCVNTLCETVWIPQVIIDTIFPEPVCDKYKFRYDSNFPEWASACIGTVTAQVVDGDLPADVQYYYWTSGADGLFVDGSLMTNMCPTETYTVTALTADGCKFSGSIIFNSDGTVTEIQIDPINWWISGRGDDSYIDYEIPDSTYSVEWILCDGSVYSGENVPLQKINCGSNKPNLILKDAVGNVVYSENISLKTSTNSITESTKFMLYPNRVNETLTLQIGDIESNNLSFEISNIKGQVLLKKKITDLHPGQRCVIDVSHVGNGIYIGKLLLGNKVLGTEKFMK